MHPLRAILRRAVTYIVNVIIIDGKASEQKIDRSAGDPIKDQCDTIERKTRTDVEAIGALLFVMQTASRNNGESVVTRY